MREKHTAEHAVKIVGNSSFSISTMWASGKQRSLQWLSANVTFREQGSMKEWPPYLEIDGLDTRYRVLPDAMVAPERINGMPTIFIAGWQAYRANKDHFGSSHYSKDEALYFRMETNPVVGETKSGWFRSAGHKIYEHKEGYRFLHYFLNSEGTQKTVDHDAWLVQKGALHLYLRVWGLGKYPSFYDFRSFKDEVDFHAKKSYDPTMELQVPGERPRPLKRPVDDLLMLVQGVLGEISCILLEPGSCFCISSFVFPRVFGSHGEEVGVSINVKQSQLKSARYGHNPLLVPLLLRLREGCLSTLRLL